MAENKIQEYLRKSFEMYTYLTEGLDIDNPFSPGHIYVEPTNACNLNCLHCARPSIHRPLVFMETGVFENILLQLEKASWNPKLTLTGQGEPLLHKDIFEFIKKAKAKGFFVSMITNATLLTEEKAMAMIESGLDRVQFSFDSIDKSVYEKIRRGSNFDKTLANILKFLEINENKGHPCYASVSSVQSEEVALGKEEFVAFWKKYPIDNVFLSPFSTLQGKSELKSQGKKEGQRQLCILPWLEMSIKADGSIVACPHDYDDAYVIGAIPNDSIPLAWNGEKMKVLRKAIIDENFSFFTSINHNCEECNNCYIGYGLDDYLKDYFLRMEKNLEPYFLKYDKKRNS